MAHPALEQPVDRCPFSRDFTPGFAGCPSYSATDFHPFDSTFRPLQTVTTCRHLVAGEGGEGAFYPRCAIGSAHDRERWLAAIGSPRLERLRELSLEYRTWVAPRMALLWQAKAAWLAALESGRRPAERAAELEQAVEAVLADADRWAAAHAERLAEVGIEGDALRDLIALSTRAWAATPNAGVDYRIPDEILDRFPEPVQIWIRSGR